MTYVRIIDFFDVDAKTAQKSHFLCKGESWDCEEIFLIYRGKFSASFYVEKWLFRAILASASNKSIILTCHDKNSSYKTSLLHKIKLTFFGKFSSYIEENFPKISVFSYAQIVTF